MTKIFCIGFHKTGTNSLGEALTCLGYKVCGVRHDLLPSLKNDEDSTIMEIVKGFDAFKDNPWPVLFKKLDTLFPGSKFILSLREETGWIRSIVNHFNSTPSEMIQFIYHHPYPAGNENDFLSVYLKHNEEVLEYFSNRPQDLLVLNLDHKSGWEPLCHFLGHPVPEIPFPHSNKGAYTMLGKKIKRFRKGVSAKLRSFRNPDS